MEQLVITHEDAEELYVMLEAYRALHIKGAALRDINSDNFQFKWDEETLTIVNKTIIDKETPKEV